MSVNIKYKDTQIASITETATRTLKTSGKYCEGDIVIENKKDSGGDLDGGTGTDTFKYGRSYANSEFTIDTGLFSSSASGSVLKYRDSAAEVSSGTTLTSSVNCNVGDLVIAAIVVRSALTISDGWTLIGTSTAIDGDDLNQTLSWAYKYAESTSESITVTQASSARIYINMASLQGATGFVDNGFIYDTATDTTTFTTAKPSGLVLWAASKPTWDTSTPYSLWSISNDSTSTQLGTTTQSRLALFYDQSNDSEVTFTSGTTGVRTFGSLTIQGMSAFRE